MPVTAFVTTPMTALDPRLHPYRPDLAAQTLRGSVEALLYAECAPMRVIKASAPLRRARDATLGYETELVYGEIFEVYELKEGWAWGQAQRDGYVGYLRADTLGPQGDSPTHRIQALRSFLYGIPNIKVTPLGHLPFGAEVAVLSQDGDFFRTPEGFLYAPHLAPLARREDDPLAVAERFLGIPYLWGGKSSLGLDCSGLVQTACHACGIPALRDSDMQEASLGEAVPVPDSPAGYARGDLLFWPGHVALAQGAGRMIHANAHFMEVTSEPIGPALARIAAKGSALRTVRRLPKASV